MTGGGMNWITRRRKDAKKKGRDFEGVDPAVLEMLAELIFNFVRKFIIRLGLWPLLEGYSFVRLQIIFRR